MRRLVVLGALALILGATLSLLKWEGEADISWMVATSPWWLYGCALALLYVGVSAVVTVNLMTGK